LWQPRGGSASRLCGDGLQQDQDAAQLERWRLVSDTRCLSQRCAAASALCQRAESRAAAPSCTAVQGTRQDEAAELLSTPKCMPSILGPCMLVLSLSMLVLSLKKIQSLKSESNSCQIDVLSENNNLGVGKLPQNPSPCHVHFAVPFPLPVKMMLPSTSAIRVLPQNAMLMSSSLCIISSERRTPSSP
jgi:hypothetical protein